MTKKSPDSKLRKSLRADGRGHRPKGPSQPAPPKPVADALGYIRDGTNDERLGPLTGNTKGEYRHHGYYATAARIGVGINTLIRWCKRERHPQPDYYDAIIREGKSVLAAIAKAK